MLPVPPHHHDAGVSTADWIAIIAGVVTALATIAAAWAAWFTAQQAKRAADRADETSQKAREALSASLRPLEIGVGGGGELRVWPNDHSLLLDATAVVEIERHHKAHGSALRVTTTSPLLVAWPEFINPAAELPGDTYGGVVHLEYIDERRLGRWRADVSFWMQNRRVDPSAYITGWTYLGHVE